MTLHVQLAALSAEFQQLRGNPLRVAPFSTLARGQAELLAALPPRYAEVLHGLLDRLESSALFAEESCSFSQTDLLDSLQLWLDKAGQQLRG
jgi:hypothetical protein